MSDNKKLPTDYQSFIHLSRYSRWLPDQNRRENWEETVTRYFDFFEKHLENNHNFKFTPEELKELKDAVLNLEVMPSMRALMAAGPALERCNVAGYNCSFRAIDSIRAFDEILYVLLCGTGVGFSVERQEVSKLPEVPEELYQTDTVIVVEDSKIGWAKALKELLAMLYSGQIPKWDVSKIRPAGAPLKVFGGRASGPDPLVSLFKFVIQIFKQAKGRKLQSIECHDIVCKIAEIVVVGGVRRSALISLSNLSDDRMRHAKNGQWWNDNPQRALANNSVAYTEKPDMGIFMDEWKTLYDSKSGERGIFNRIAAKKQMVKHGRRDNSFDFGTNPCLTGDTNIYVADGRGSITLKQLAEEGQDVPVFCYDNKHNIIVRKLRNPRITGYNKKIFEVEIEGGFKIKCTENHKFLLASGEYKELKDINIGDGLKLLKKHIVRKKQTKCLYTLLQTINKAGTDKKLFEHRPVCEYYHGSIPTGCHIHHKDYNGLNNHISNLEIMTIQDHINLHKENMMGDKNPMRRAKTEWSREKWNDYSTNMSKATSGNLNGNSLTVPHDTIKEHAIILTKQLGCRFSTGNWVEYAKENKLPQTFTKWRTDAIGTISTLAKWAEKECGLENYKDLDPRQQRKLFNLLDHGYDVEFINSEYIFTKECVCCNKKFKTKNREISYCSFECNYKFNQDPQLKVKNKKHLEAVRCKMVAALRKSHKDRKKILRQKQADIFCSLKFKLGRVPSKKEWISACKESNLSFEISRISSPFRTYKQLGEYSNSYNHKIVNIKEVGYEDVYNGTVDEFHNFFIGGFEEKCPEFETKNLFWKQFKIEKSFTFFNNRQCGEILLKNSQFCNLSEVVIRSDDTKESIKNKIKKAVILGTIQSTLSNFKYIGKKWKNNTEEERLLGVSLTGIMDNRFTAIISDELSLFLSEMRDYCVKINEQFANKLNIPPSAAITCAKPSGTVSQLVDSASGIHPRHSQYYIRTVRADNKDPLCKMMKDMGFPNEPEQFKPDSVTVFSFPIKSPEGCLTRNDFNAIEHLELWKCYYDNWCEHNPSVTISVKEHEWLEVAAWVYKNFDNLCGISFLPHSDHVYVQAPYQECTEEEYNNLLSKMPVNVDWSKISEYEKEDTTTSSQELACTGGSCEIP